MNCWKHARYIRQLRRNMLDNFLLFFLLFLLWWWGWGKGNGERCFFSFSLFYFCYFNESETERISSVSFLSMNVREVFFFFFHSDDDHKYIKKFHMPLFCCFRQYSSLGIASFIKISMILRKNESGHLAIFIGQRFLEPNFYVQCQNKTN